MTKIKKSAFDGAIGNAMTVPVLERVLPYLCWVAGLLPRSEEVPRDPWKSTKWVKRGGNFTKANSEASFPWDA